MFDILSFGKYYRRAKNVYYRFIRLLPARVRSFLSKIKPLLSYFIFKMTGKPLSPDEVILDPANICNLRCPLCPTGLRKLDFPKHIMDFGTFTRIVDQIVRDFPFLNIVHLFSWGEPFLNPDIFRMIRYLKKNDFFILIDTNFSFQKDRLFFDSLIESGLDVLTVSIDGVKAGSYAAYRQGGDFHQVISNLHHAITAKQRLKKQSPEIIWKFIIHRNNEDEIYITRQKAAEFGVGFGTALIGLGDAIPDMEFDQPLESRKSAWLPRKRKYINPCYLPDFQGPAFKEPIRFCPFLFKTLVISPDGMVAPCPVVTSIRNIFGDAKKEPLKKIWNNNYFRYSRRIFTNKKRLDKSMQTICLRCRNFSG